MANKSRISQELNRIKKSLIRGHPHTYHHEDLRLLFLKNKKKWNLPAAMNHKKFIESLEVEGLIIYCELDFAAECYDGYFLCSSNAEYMITQLVPKTYLCHFTALRIWEMTEVLDKLYINREQSPASLKAKKGEMLQSAIDSVFAKPQRQSGALAEFNSLEVVLVQGKFTGQLGVTEIDQQNKEQILVTDLERTLIDCVVRPAYALPPAEMVAVFRKARERIDIRLLWHYLQELNYAYPYHQCIGFYLERAGNYTPKEIGLFAATEIRYDFYLTYQLTSPAFSKAWRLYYPAELDFALVGVDTHKPEVTI